jgi:hypothetical protein
VLLLFIVGGQQTPILWSHTTDVLDFNIPFNGKHFAEANSRPNSQ